MGKSFKDQLLELGLVDKKKVGKAKRDQHQSKKKKGKAGAKQQYVDENELIAKKAEEKKKIKAQQLNKEREAKLQKRADGARIKQLVEQHRVEKAKDGVAYRFNVAGKIHRIFVTKEVQEKISGGVLGIVSCQWDEDLFEVVPRVVAEKILSIDKSVFVSLIARKSDNDADPDDPYADYKVPDDLIW